MWRKLFPWFFRDHRDLPMRRFSDDRRPMLGRNPAPADIVWYLENMAIWESVNPHGRGKAAFDALSNAAAYVAQKSNTNL